MRVGSEIGERSDYEEIRDWYLNKVPEENELDFGKDHIPDVLAQLAKKPRDLSRLELEDIPLLQAIEMPIGEVLQIQGYDPHKWKTNSQMAA